MTCSLVHPRARCGGVPQLGVGVSSPRWHRSRIQKLLISVAAIFLVGCGGGGADSATATTAAPVATTTAALAGTTTAAPAASTTAAPVTTTAAPAPTTTAPRVPTIQIINLSSLATSDIRSWTEVATAKMSARQADILGVVWPVGALVREDARDKFDAPFNEMQITLSDAALAGLLADVDTWIDATPCADVGGWRGENASSLKETLRLWIGGGADAATAPDPCFESRMAICAFATGVSSATAQRVYLHELYHALSS